MGQCGAGVWAHFLGTRQEINILLPLQCVQMCLRIAKFPREAEDHQSESDTDLRSQVTL